MTRSRAIHLLGTDSMIDAHPAADHTASQLAAAWFSGDAIVSRSRGGRVTGWNPAAERLFGWSAVEAVGRPDAFLVPSDRRDEWERLMQRVHVGERVEPLETVRLRKDGTRLDVAVTVAPLRDSGGELVAFSKVAREVVESRRLRLVLEARSAQQAAVAALSRDALTANLPTLLERAVSVVAESLGTQFASVFELQPDRHPLLLRAGVGWGEGLVGHATVGADTGAAGLVLRTDRPVVVEDLRTETRFSPPPLFRDHGIVAGISVVIPGRERPFGVLGAHTASRRSFSPDDVSFVRSVANVLAAAIENHRARQTLDRDALLLAGVRAAVVVTDLAGTVTDWNEGATRLFGWSAGEVLGGSLVERFPASDRAMVLEAARELVAGHELAGEFEVPRKDGAPMWVEGRVRRLTDGAGRPVGIVAVAHDIADCKRAEAERDGLLRELRLQTERMPLAYILCDPQLRCVRWNPAAERIFGYTATDMLGHQPFEVLPSSRSRPLVAGLLDRLRTGDMDAHGVWDAVTSAGRVVTCQWHNTPLLGDDGSFEGLLALAEDLTEKKSLEDRYRQAQKMEAVGQLAGGVAHDFNNLLTIINGYSDLLLRDLPPGDPSRDLVGEINGAGERSAALTRQLLAFSRKQVVAPRPLDLNAVVADTEKLLRRVIGEDIRLHLSLAPGLGTIEADPGQIEQVLMNLAVNARDAMPRGGGLTIETRNVELDADYVRIHADVKPGLYALLAVSDTGCGIMPEIQARIFEPFFTTKEEGRGTGLGLAVVHGIVQQAGGWAEVYSEPGIGTTLKIYLPRIEQPSRADRPQSHQRTPPPGTETILLAEDECGVRALTRHVLTGCGYRVLEAADGEAALRVAASHPGPIDLLVTDVVMPGLGGRELAEQLQQFRPRMKVLYVSGYTSEAVMRHGVVHDDTQFLQKPFSPFTLAFKVREVLDRA